MALDRILDCVDRHAPRLTYSLVVSDSWEVVRYNQIIETVRVLTAGFVQMLSAMVLGGITVTGFAFSQRSWGLTVLSTVFAVAAIIGGRRFRSIASGLLNQAETLESDKPGDVDSTAGLLRQLTVVPGGGHRFGSLSNLIYGVITIQLLFALLQATVFGWEFS